MDESGKLCVVWKEKNDFLTFQTEAIIKPSFMSKNESLEMGLDPGNRIWKSTQPAKTGNQQCPIL